MAPTASQLYPIGERYFPVFKLNHPQGEKRSPVGILVGRQALRIAAAAQYGIELERDTDLLWIVEEVVSMKTLPDGWTAYTDQGTKRTFYNHKQSGKSIWEHPLSDFYRGAIFMARGGTETLLGTEEENPPTPDEVAAMAEYMDIQISEPAEVLDVVRQAVNAPLPPGWEEYLDEQGDTAFRNPKLKKSSTEHPLGN
eukprot:CAMPEP_0198231176 /NCGR_PEP_ID=MMETSP1445-20131203/115060_1 /TAXON_ID=36898 /ORGANISM="Pyramimonas sp., Strain CCMP2087" /LENGTH=196 /DNA_ID=CAMNT_0043911771 /DNA_START=110 /DNA_END=700 /DNA_ORIENTATION=-